jgi:DNA-binding LacI/PurR family transcriptional regulator
MVIELLIRQISSDSAISDELLFEPELVVRRSTAPLPR